MWTKWLGTLLLASSALSALAQPAPPPAPADVLALPEPLKRQFREQVLDHTRAPHARLERMVDFLFSPGGLGMSYHADANHTVAEAYATRQANCMSFTLLTVALAREAGLDAYAQQVDETLAWRQDHNILYRTQHVNAGVRIRERRFTVDVAWNEVITRKPPEPIRDDRLIAHYYNNRAAALLEHGALDDALRHAEIALTLDPGYATSWSNIGVMYLRDGDGARAERAYRHALDLDADNPGALFNLVTFYQRAGNVEAARPLQKRLDAAQARDPFHHFLLAAGFERDGNLVRAAAHYRKAIQLYDGEHRFHFGLARVYFLQGDHRRAGKALARAGELSQGDTRALYQAKLDTLRRQGD
ncbi:tetratricopeptide repeat protein [Pseudoxanthomonas sp. PXM03]|uniref:tetratricopeptide repeat protein n=1 Tax=Pseudoxanthomonas sp. PXM03 TaxID=2769284 RepID=UPI00177AA330|nr:tetratricopeptide repeat protein [Pseudoxanthomonas sp. PXM03]MBD9435985.1 tetratricopeptide repeat protein [Pseudoxanthomonas sp. PXM03]